ncbi:hypothetical protein VSR01_10850 [Actinacidiphila sp. DG2A-62]|uniref:hypothetical protein n=1 Tax=Actinacidiphila sp. DG2A-62 TaxID=3108821 RepID=UPI002DBC2DB2|nr:hypothetical protein [Actinacidiphila sp. DG2A-62]MEC3994017.1 hypothetical protein [Actinacidiphila sp. DG2A-62]
MNTDKQFYDQRANDLTTAVDSGDIDSAARIAAAVLIEEGGTGLSQLTDAVERNQQR